MASGSAQKKGPALQVTPSTPLLQKSANSQNGNGNSRVTSQATTVNDRASISSKSSKGSFWDKVEADVDSYFIGPRDLDDYSNLPYWMRIRSSVLPKMLVPLLCVGLWAAAITCVSMWYRDLAISSLLLNILGFVVALALSFRSTTAYERYGDGRKVWTALTLQSRNMARVIWLHTEEREGELGKEDILSKLTAINMILSFAVALKHRLRFEPHTQYEDMKELIGNLHTFAHEAFDDDVPLEDKKSIFTRAGEFLDIPFAMSNPRRMLNRSKKPVGNLPLEILNHLSVWAQTAIKQGLLELPIAQTTVLNGIAALTECMGDAERVLNTPLPMAYNIAFSQITMIYVYILPFQLLDTLGWVTIPGTMIAAYIILGISTIGNELENPFGLDVNDLPLDSFCQELSAELNMITSTPSPSVNDFMISDTNMVLHPISKGGYNDWSKRSVKDIRDALKAKSMLSGRKTPKQSLGMKGV